jgi:hypothetical protein
MLLTVILNEGSPYGDPRDRKVPGVKRTEKRDGKLVAINGAGDEVAEFDLADVRAFDLTED